MAHVPLPLILRLEGPEVRVARIDGRRSELEQTPGLIAPAGIVALYLIGLVGHTILFHGALHQHHGTILQMCGLLDFVIVHHQVGRAKVTDHSCHMLPAAVTANDPLQMIVMQAVCQFRLVAITLTATERGSRHIGASEVVRLEGLACIAQVELATNHIRLQHGPTIGTDAAPTLAIETHLHTSLVDGTSATQSHIEPRTWMYRILGQLTIIIDAEGNRCRQYSIFGWITHDTSCLAGLTVVDAPPVEVAIGQLTLVSLTEQIVHPVTPSCGPKVATVCEATQPKESQLTTHDFTLGSVPFIVADSAPFVVVQHLDVAWKEGDKGL